MKQHEALAILKLGHNVLLTGPAGSGKTYLLNQYITHLKKTGVAVAITASTGIAATHIGGRTIHSWAGIGIKDQLSKKDISTLTKRSYLKKQFEKVEVLVIDEISMLHAHRLDMIDTVCQAFKKNFLPFGGIQVIMSGDFFQLPPISPGTGEAEFVYKSNIWRDMDLRVCYLSEQYRQNDKSMTRVLKGLRENDISSEIVDLLKSRMNQKIKTKIKPIKLFTHNIDVDVINNNELKKINSPEIIYRMTSSGEKKLVESLKKNCLAPEDLILKKGAQVMFVKNKFKNEKAIYINGSMGVIIDFDESGFPIVRLNSGKEVSVTIDSWTIDSEDKILAKINQVPLRLAYAITVHKSQGMTLEAAEIDLSRSFGYGMGYVALSRLTNLEGLYLLGINEMAYKLNPQVFDYEKELLILSQKAKSDMSPKVYKKQSSLIME
ncbi:MAG: PIF1 family DEAD/DEAH box helicase [Patescibacteria group bacterium]|nr:PIF1 family DEAD/DEAH box helicase [Patescibacteria group bacterium]MDD4303975.1 PIF1 family DEAD/DEAH box helicase [Patescibacteria group bacterium]MDD4695036.1 PIF1 family DEAD/DEAH box helicase [Patescibacteria group bacterium]